MVTVEFIIAMICEKSYPPFKLELTIVFFLFHVYIVVLKWRIVLIYGRSYVVMEPTTMLPKCHLAG